MIFLLQLLTVVLTGLKLTGVILISWYLVLAPAAVGLAFALGFAVAVVIVEILKEL